MMKTALITIFLSRLRKMPKDKIPKHSHRKYRSPIERWKAIIKSVLIQQKLIKRQKHSIIGSMSCAVNETSNKCGDRGRRATILSLFPTTGRSVPAIRHSPPDQE